MGLEMVSRVRRYQGQCWALQPLGHQGYRLRSYRKDPPLYSDFRTVTMPLRKVSDLEKTMAAASGVFCVVCSEEPPYHRAEELCEGLKHGTRARDCFFFSASAQK